MGRYLGLDYGQKRVGVALSCPLNMLALGLMTIENRSSRQLLQEIQHLVTTHDVVGIILGLPLRTTGGPGPEAEGIRQWGERLQAQTGVPVYYEDERYTSTIARQALQAQGKSPSRHKALVDQTAAALILQQFLDKTAADRAEI